MTREEEIKNYAYNNCINDDIDDTSYSLIIETARWADETMIEKAKKWLENELYEVMTEPNPYYISEVQSKSYNSLEVLINDFKKAMEL